MPESNLVLIESEDPELRRAIAGEIGTPLPWILPSDPRAAEATVWLCPSRPPAAARSLPNLRWIHSGWAGIDDWITRPEWRDGIALTRTVGDFPERIAEYVAGYLLADALGVRNALAGMARRFWEPWIPRTLAGRSLLVVGHGQIGRRVAALARALGMFARGIRRGPLSAEDLAHGVEDASALPALLPSSDVVVNLLPLTPETRSFWSADRLARMKPGSVFVNVSRGATVDQDALLAALRAGRPSRAILDVFREEPLPHDHPLWSMPGVWITPHLAGTGTSDVIAREFAANWKRWERGEPLAHPVDRARGY